MTLPPSLAELDLPSATETGLIRVTVLIGELRLDIGLPGDAEIRSYMADLLDIANTQLSAAGHRDMRFDDGTDRWTLAPLGAAVIDPSRTLSAHGVFDGDILMVRATASPSVPTLFDDIANTRQTSPAFRWLADHRTTLASFTFAFVAAVGWAWCLPRTGPAPTAAFVTLAAGLLLVAGSCVESRRNSDVLGSAALSVLAVPLVFTGALCVVPEGFGVPALPLAFGLTALTAQLSLQISGTGHVWHSFVIAVSLLGAATAVAVNVWHAPPRAIGAVVTTVAVIVLYLAPRVTILLARLPIPRVPTAGEPLDEIETHGGPTVEGVSAVGLQIVPTEERLLARVRRANQYLTGILVGVALTAVFGCYLTVDTANGFYWQGTLFAVVTATALCLRGRSHHDLVQSATMIGSGLAIAVVVIVKTAVELPGWHARAGLAAIALAALAILCGVVAPRCDFSPVMRRAVEIGEYLVISLVFPLCFWIVGLYGYVRGMRF